MVEGLFAHSLGEPVVVGSHVEAARNLADIPFPHRASHRDLRQVWNTAVRVAQEVSDDQVQAWPAEELDRLTTQALCECGLLVRDALAIPGCPGRGLVVRLGEWAMLVNEEDHLRLLCLMPGRQLEEGLATVWRLSDELGSWLSFAHSLRYGYLASSLSHIGCGVVPSALVALSATRLARRLDKVRRQLRDRGLLTFQVGQEPGAGGEVYRCAAQGCGGEDDRGLLRRVKVAQGLTLASEKAATQMLAEEREQQILDAVWRAWGILRHARRLAAREAQELLGWVRLGCYLEVFKGTLPALNRLVFLVRPATLQLYMGQTLGDDEQQEARAELVRGLLH